MEGRISIQPASPILGGFRINGEEISADIDLSNISNHLKHKSDKEWFLLELENISTIPEQLKFAIKFFIPYNYYGMQKILKNGTLKHTNILSARLNSKIFTKSDIHIPLICYNNLNQQKNQFYWMEILTVTGTHLGTPYLMAGQFAHFRIFIINSGNSEIKIKICNARNSRGVSVGLFLKSKRKEAEINLISNPTISKISLVTNGTANDSKNQTLHPDITGINFKMRVFQIEEDNQMFIHCSVELKEPGNIMPLNFDVYTKFMVKTPWDQALAQNYYHPPELRMAQLIANNSLPKWQKAFCLRPTKFGIVIASTNIVVALFWIVCGFIAKNTLYANDGKQYKHK